MNLISNISIYISLIVICSSCEPRKELTQTEREIANLRAFAKIYGYVRWFHPSDEASAVDWDSLCVAGIQIVKNARTNKGLIDSLNKIFSPITTGLRISNDPILKNKISRNGKQEVYWTHSGVGNEATYTSSLRKNRNDPDFIKKNGILLKVFEINDRSSDIQSSFNVKGALDKGSQLLIVSAKHYMGGSKEWQIDTIEDLKTDWKKFTVSTSLDKNETGLIFFQNSAILIGSGEISIQEPEVVYEKNKEPLPDYENFSVFHEGSKVDDFIITQWNTYEYSIKSNALTIKSYENENKVDRLFLKPNNIFTDEILPGLHISLPSILFLNEQPQLDTTGIKQIQKIVRESYRQENEWLAATVVLWNTINHFFPYLNDLELDWESHLDLMLAETMQVHSDLDYYLFLYESTAALKDGHQTVLHESAKFKVPPFHVAKFGDDVIITATNDSSRFNVGDRILRYDTTSAIQEYQYWYNLAGGSASAASYNTKERFGMRIDSTRVNMRLLRNLDTLDQDIVITLPHYNRKRPFTHLRKEWLKDSLLYLDLSRIDSEVFEEIVNEMSQARGIIMDMRNGCLPREDLILNHFIDSAQSFKPFHLFTPVISEPNQANIRFDELPASWTIIPKTRTVTAPTCVLTSGKLLSGLESLQYALQLKRNNIAFIGQPTAGGDGMVNSITLPGEFKYIFTQVYFLRIDSTKHHGIGFIPDVVAEPAQVDYLSDNDRVLLTGIAELEKMIE